MLKENIFSLSVPFATASFLLSPKACIPVRRSYACWCKSFEYALFLLPKQNRLPYIEFSLKQSRLLPAHQDSTLGKYTFYSLMCDCWDCSPNTFCCLCVQLPLFPFYEQWKICRVLFRGTSSPALYQYVRLHSRYVFLTAHFQKDYSCEGQ